MAHQMTDRELRILRRNQLIEEQERQQKIDEEIVYLQSQREQHVLAPPPPVFITDRSKAMVLMCSLLAVLVSEFR